MAEKKRPEDKKNKLPPPVQNFINSVLGVIDTIATLFRGQEWSILLILFAGIGYFLFNPTGGFIAKDVLPDPPPLLYGQLFWFVEAILVFSIIVLEIFQKILSAIRGHREDDSGNKYVFLFITFFLVVILVLVLNGGSSFLQARSFPSKYLKCGISGDCFSMGETIMMIHDYSVEEGSVPSWQKACREHWRQKAAAVSLYGTKEATEALESFETNCPNDAETQIYLNNIRAIKDSRPAILGGGPLKIAVSLPISREGGEEESQEILRGVAIAQKQINEANGIDGGRRILVLIANDGYSITGTSDNRSIRATQIARALREEKDIVGVIGHFTSDATEVASLMYAPVSDESEVAEDLKPLVSISPTSTAIRDPNISDDKKEGLQIGHYVFRTAPDDGLVASTLARIAATQYDRVAIVSESESSFSQLFEEIFRQAFIKANNDDQNAVLSGSACVFDTGGRDSSGTADICLETAREHRGNLDKEKYALLLVPSTKSSALIQPIVKENYENEENSFGLLGADSMYSKKFISKQTEGMVIYIPWHAKSDEVSNFNNQGIRGDFSQFQDSEITWRTAMSYDASQVLISGIQDASKKCSSRFGPWSVFQERVNSTRYPTCIREKLRASVIKPDTTPRGISGDDIAFDEKGDRAIDVDYLGVFVMVQEVTDNNELSYDFVPRSEETLFALE